jgi:hypothetical protein
MIFNHLWIPHTKNACRSRGMGIAQHLKEVREGSAKFILGNRVIPANMSGEPAGIIYSAARKAPACSRQAQAR